MIYIKIDKSNAQPLHRQIYHALRTQILEGHLKHSYKLPSSRALSKDLNVSRNVVIESYDRLIAEGFIEATEESGTYVSDGAFLEGYKKIELSPKKSIIGLIHEPDDAIIDFRTSVPILDYFQLSNGDTFTKTYVIISILLI